MGFKLSLTRGQNELNGVIANAYAKINGHSINSGMVNVTVGLFLDKEARDLAETQDNQHPGMRNGCFQEVYANFSEDDLPEVAEVIIIEGPSEHLKASIYTWLQINDDLFKTATSVFEDGQTGA